MAGAMKIPPNANQIMMGRACGLAPLNETREKEEVEIIENEIDSNDQSLPADERQNLADQEEKVRQLALETIFEIDPAKACIILFKDLSIITHELKGYEVQAVTHPIAKEGYINILHINEKEIDENHRCLNFVYFFTNQKDPFRAVEYLTEGTIKDAFWIKITENDPGSTERQFEVESLYRTKTGNAVIVNFSCDTKEWSSDRESDTDQTVFNVNFALPSIKENCPSDKEAWKRFFYQLVLVRNVLKTSLNFWQNIPEVPKPDSEPKMKPLKEGFLEAVDAKSKIEFYPLVPPQTFGTRSDKYYQVSWLDNIWQASHVPVKHADEQIQKARVKQAGIGTRLASSLLGCTLIGLTFFAMVKGFKSRKIKRKN